MSDSTPADLAVAFRSFGRRLGDAEGNADDARQVAAIRQARRHLDAGLQQAAKLLGVAASADLIARKIDQTPVDRWSSELLDQLRSIVSDVSGQVRDAERAIED